MRIAVVGLGKIGLPLAVQFADSGHAVIGVDINPSVVSSVSVGRAPFPGEDGLEEKLSRAVSVGNLRATQQYSEAIPSADVVVVVVPLFVDDDTWEPDYSSMDAASMSLGSFLSASTLVIYETTLPVGTTRNRWKPLLEQASGLSEGRDFHLAFSPERVLSGRVFSDLRRYPKLVGGLSAAGTARAVEFYSSVLQFEERDDLKRSNGVWDLGSAEAAELAKLAETTYRDVNIGLANQFALYADREGIDFHKVIDACNSQPFSNIHRPGIAVGGHCIPVYPRLYLATDEDASIVRTARIVNASVPQRVIDEAGRLFGSLKGLRVAVMGASYRGGVKEVAFSGVFPVVQALTSAGAHVEVHDPLFSVEELSALGMTPYSLGQPVDLVVIQADHEEYSALSASDFPGVRLLVDGRNVTDASRWPCVPRYVLGAGGLQSDEDVSDHE